jgi:hypothetical protein
MSNTTTKVLTGCGVGCLLIVVALVGLGWMGYRWGKTAAEAGIAAEQAEDRLEAEYGRARDFTPPALLSGDRIEAFLVIRESIEPQRTELTESVQSLAPDDDQGGRVSGLAAARIGIGMAPRVLEFVRVRNESMLETGMGPGEYTWIYWFTYNAWLGHPGGDSLLSDILEAHAESDSSTRLHIDGMDHGDVARQLRRQVEPMFRNLERAMASDPEDSEMGELLTAELVAIEADYGRLPWQDGLPEVFATGLEPYRERLETSYSRATNPFELIELDDGPQGIQIH